jgi:hypothetical protein
MVLAGSYGCHATTDATADVLRNGSSKHASAATARSTYSYGSHKFNRPYWTLLQRKRGCARTTWSWRVSATWGKRYVTPSRYQPEVHLLYSSSGANNNTFYVAITS